MAFNISSFDFSDGARVQADVNIPTLASFELFIWDASLYIARLFVEVGILIAVLDGIHVEGRWL